MAADNSRRSGQEYRNAANQVEMDKNLTEQANRVKEFQVNRQLENAVGSTQAAIAGNGFTNSGSALDLLRDATTQGSIASSLTATGDVMQLNDMENKAQAYMTEAKNADETADAQDMAGLGSFIGGAFKGLGAVANLAPLLLL